MRSTTSHPQRIMSAEDPTNFWPVDFAARGLLPVALKLKIPANAISIGGFVIGAAGALALNVAPHDRWTLIALLLSLIWLLADSLDGRVARASGTASRFGRELDGFCDHGVFLMFYLALGMSMGTGAGWRLVALAAVAHVVQANLYEAERRRFKRREFGIEQSSPHRISRNPLIRLYDWSAALADAGAAPFERSMGCASTAGSLLAIYRKRATAGFRMLTVLSADVRILILILANLLRAPRIFCWIEIGPLSLATLLGILWHRSVERNAIIAEAETHPAIADALPEDPFCEPAAQAISR